MLLNLLLNGIQSMNKPGAVVLATGMEDNWAIISVSDSGCGIRPSDLTNIFRPFFTTKGHGTGLGLSLARRIVEEHGGRIEVASELGQGTTFSVFLPLHRSAAESDLG